MLFLQQIHFNSLGHIKYLGIHFHKNYPRFKGHYIYLLLPYL